MPLLKDCFGCFTTIFLIGLVLLGLSLYFGVPALLDYIQQFTVTG
jgi:hypothetical protein